MSGALGQNALIYDTNTLIGIVPNLKLAQSFLLDRFFPRMVTEDSEFISIDVDVGMRRMAPFVSPLVEGKLVEQRRMQTNTFKPAYIKDKRAPDLRKPIRRMIGERIGGNLTGMEREIANLNFEMEDQIDMVTRRLEWMASQALQTGTVTITGDGFPSVTINFGRSAALTVALTGSNVWGFSSGFNPDGRDPLPTRNLETWQHLVLKASGAKMTDIVFTTTPYELFLNSEFAQGAIQWPRLAEFGNAINPGAQIDRGAVFKGVWGQYNLWVYNDWYVDPVTNIETPMIPDGTVIMCGPDLMGIRAFGQILDPAFNYAGLPFAPKTWVMEDPAQRLILMQSSPMVIPSRVNACLAATVCAPVVN
jgi:hypothetical protein